MGSNPTEPAIKPSLPDGKVAVKDFITKAETSTRNKKGRREYLSDIKTRDMMDKLNDYFESMVEIPRIKVGERQTIEVNNQASLVGIKMSIKISMLRTFSPILSTFPQFAGILTPPLRTVCIEPTNACNLHCRMCNAKGRALGYMNMELFRRIIRHDLKEFPNTTVHLNFGGESFLHPQFDEMMQECISTKRRVSGIFTNGMLIEPYVETIAKTFSTITFSLDGVGKVNDEIRLGCNYEKVIQNIRKLKAARERLSTGIQIEVNCTKTTQTDAELEEFLSEMKDFADTVKIGMVRDANNRLAKSQPSVAPFCYYPFSDLIVLWNGEVSYCGCSTPFPPCDWECIRKKPK